MSDYSAVIDGNAPMKNIDITKFQKCVNIGDFGYCKPLDKECKRVERGKCPLLPKKLCGCCKKGFTQDELTFSKKEKMWLCDDCTRHSEEDY
jgi:hypothetical protein